MSTRDATLLPPPPELDSPEDRSSGRSLDQVGVENVLDAMRQVKARRESRPSFTSESETTTRAESGIDAREREERDANGEIRRRHRVPADSDAFLKAR